MNLRLRLFLSLVLLVTGTACAQKIRRTGTSLTASAVAVNDAALGHTTQLLSSRKWDDVNKEIEDVFGQLSKSLSSYSSAKSDLVKINLYATDAEGNAIALRFLEEWTPSDSRPAVSTVATALPNDRSFGLDAVFVARDADSDKNVTHSIASGKPKHAIVSLLPRGDVVYISGQAQPGDLAAATKATLEGLLDTLRGMKLKRSDIVQVKCFLQPMSQVKIVDREIAAFFEDAPIAAVSHVEWIAGGTRPIEIEVIAAAPLTKTEATVSYYTPAGMRASPVFSRVARIHGNRRVYVAGMVAFEEGKGAAQVQSIFQQLIRQLRPTRSNLRHMAKATYYVSEADSSSQLNKLRPHYYDPKRPPAASKAMVKGVGIKNRSLSIDIIAAPEAPLNRVLDPLAAKLKPTSKLVYKTVKQRNLHLHLFEPKGHKKTDRRPVLLAIHGGGWTGGNAKVFYPFAAHFAKKGMLGISLEYRLSSPKEGTTVFDCVRDARSAVRWIRKNATRIGADPDRIVVIGGSAGGHLAVSTALFDKFNAQSDDINVSPSPNALVLLYPVIDTSSAGYGKNKIGRRWRELSPVHNVRGKLPPTLIFHGTADAVTPYVGAERFQRLSLAAGNSSRLITHPGGRHGYLVFERAEYDRALTEIKRFIESERLLKR